MPGPDVVPDTAPATQPQTQPMQAMASDQAHPPQANVTILSYSIHNTTIGPNCFNFPAPKSRQAPKTFDGNYNENEDFLTEFDNLTNAHHLYNKSHLELLPKYVGHKVKQTLLSLQEFYDQDWEKLCIILKKLYNHGHINRTYTEKSLLKYIEGSSSGRQSNISDF